jgi:F-type H+-transporting ATPase subunit epsilon
VRLLLTVPTGILVDEPVTKVLAESAEGSFCLLPRHLDLATVLVPGPADVRARIGRREVVVAVDHGVLVKVGADVRVACQRAYVAGDLEEAERVPCASASTCRASARSGPGRRWRGWRATWSGGWGSCGGAMAPERPPA